MREKSQKLWTFNLKYAFVTRSISLPNKKQKEK